MQVLSRRVRRLSLGLVAVLCLGCGGRSETSQRADVLLNEALGAGTPAIPGISVAVYRGGRLVHSGAAGLADIATSEASTPDTRYRLYSTAKTLTAAAAFRLADEGIVDLDAPIGTYLGDLPDDKKPITLRQLLAHRGGIRHYADGEWLSVSGRACADPAEALSDFIDDPLTSTPGSETRYTSFGYVLVSAVLTEVTGQSFDGMMRQTLFEPAGMQGIALEGVSRGDYPASEFYLTPESEEEPPRSTSTLNIDASCKFGGGGFIGRATDLAAFGNALIHGDLLSAQSLKTMTREITPAHPEGRFPPMGYGIFPEERFPGFPDVPKETVTRAWWHGGSAAGGYSVLIAYPDKDVSVGIAANINAGGRLIFVAHDIASLWF